MISKKLLSVCILSFSIICLGCGSKRGKGLNFFPTKKDIKLGLDIKEQIENRPEEYPILSKEENEEIYDYINGIINKILDTGKVKHRDEFAWELTIIDDDETLNAFSTPGGYLYLYTGLIKFLDSEDQLAGVLGHEIAHAANRHSTRQMSRNYSIKGAFAIMAAIGSSDSGSSDPDGELGDAALGFLTRKFSRSHEKESDRFAMHYLCATEYNATGIASFFKKMQTLKMKTPFLSIHPSPTNRIEVIEKKAKKMDCSSGETFRRRYVRMKSLLN